jgi:NAD(P)-dependent dehydrogenase (short-subunit alcohol dehydrogenase family)
MPKKIIFITGASSGFGRLTAEALARAGHIVYASMRETGGRNAPRAEALVRFSKERGVDLRPIELDVQSQESGDRTVKQVIADSGRIDVLIHKMIHCLSLTHHSPLHSISMTFTPLHLGHRVPVRVLGDRRL